MLYFFLIISCTITGPEDSTGSEEFDSSYNVRVINETSDTIKVTIGPKDFGFIAPVDTTEYFPVYMGDNEVFVGDTVIDTMLTGSSDPPPPAQCEMYWTYTFHSSGGYGSYMDQSLTNLDNCW